MNFRITTKDDNFMVFNENMLERYMWFDNEETRNKHVEYYMTQGYDIVISKYQVNGIFIRRCGYRPRITQVNINEVIEDSYKSNNKKYNVNNLGDTLPDDYYKEIFKTKNWVSNDIKRYTFNNQYEINWLKEACAIGSQTSQFPKSYLEELDDFLEKYKEIDQVLKHGYFIRTDNCSLKDGYYGNIKYTSLKQIIYSIVTSDPFHAPLNKRDTLLTIYLFPFLDMIQDKEFRVFVYNNKITAISQQFIYKRNEWLSKMNETEILHLINRIVDFFENHVMQRIQAKNYTFDLVLLENDEFYFIEPNDFGANYGAGSSLFHWKTDNSILTNNVGNVEFRYCY